jgi:hypothetical protein
LCCVQFACWHSTLQYDTAMHRAHLFAASVETPQFAQRMRSCTRSSAVTASIRSYGVVDIHFSIPESSSGSATARTSFPTPRSIVVSAIFVPSWVVRNASRSRSRSRSSRGCSSAVTRRPCLRTIFRNFPRRDQECMQLAPVNSHCECTSAHASSSLRRALLGV